MKNCDLIIDNACVVTVDDQNNILENHAVIITDGLIVEILSSEHVNGKYLAKTYIDAKNQILMPGMINMHTHIPMTYFRGLADDLPLNVWLEKYIWPNEAKYISDSFIYDASIHGIAELIKNGITQFNDMYFIPTQTANACVKAGIRAVISDIGLDFPMGDFHQPDQCFEKIRNLKESYQNEDHVRFSLGPHAIYTCSEETLKKCRDISQKENVLIHMHLSETAFEVEQCLEKNGLRPVEYLEKIGLLNENLLIAHGVHLNEKEVELLKKYNVSVCINTESNLKLASGFAPIKLYLDYGVNLCLGTDGVASNNNLSLFDEMSVTSKVHKALNMDPTLLSATQMLRMVTVNAAKALGQKDILGSIEPGKKADLVILNTENVESQPFYHPSSLIVYCLNHSAVSDVIINGKIVMRNKELLTINESEIIEKAKEYKMKLK
ncbi:MAG TPA: amidohydrolase family protein [Candidatus Cloacimonadota bacterium]|nr:amidohydrolase family protein [Candidatus Cloacimonadota bacterium]